MMKKLWQHTLGYRRWIGAGIACSGGEAIFELLIPLVMVKIVSVGIPTADIGYITKLGLLMVFMAMISMALGFGSAHFSARAGQGFGANLRHAQFQHIQDFAFENIEHFTTASLITRMTSDVNAIQMTLMMSMRLLVRCPVQLVTALVLSIYISVQLSLTFAVTIPILLVFITFIILNVGPRFRKMQECTDGVNLVVQENVTNIRVVKSFAREAQQRGLFALRNRALQETTQGAFGIMVTAMPTMMLIIYGTVIAILWFGGHMVYDGALEVANLTALFTYSTQILMSLMMVSMISTMAIRSLACARRVHEVLSEVPAFGDDTADETLTVQDGSIDFDHVYFKYHATAEAWNLEDVNLHIPSGATVGILGGTGSAKSTLVSLIPRLYQANQGTVRVGGRDVADYSLDALRKDVSMVLQQNTLFSGTILENLRWGNPDATEEEVLEACKAACVDEFLDRMEQGLHTDLGQGGVNVSGGQKQRLCIARALLKRPKILILDDSTSAVDTATDGKIRGAFAAALPDTTKLIIAQRITSVMDADLILVLDDGKILAQGTHQELLDGCQVYRQIYDAQQKGVGFHGE